MLSTVVSSLKLRVISVCVIAGLGGALGAGLTVHRVTQAELQRQILANERTDRERTASLLGSKLEMLTTSMRAAAAHVRPAQLEDPEQVLELLHQQSGLGALFDSVLAARFDGQMLARVEKGQRAEGLPNISDREYFRRTMSGDQAVVSDPILGRVNGQPIVVICAPILGADGRPLGLLGGSLRLQSNSLFADGMVARADDARDLVMDRRGTILSHTALGRIMGKAVDEPGLQTVIDRWQSVGSPIDTLGTAEVTQEHVVSMAGIPASDWVLVRVTPITSALAPLAAARRTAVVAALVAAALSSLLAGLVAWAIARPISQLRDRAERMIIDGDDSADDWPRQGGEIGAMTQAFQVLLQTRAGQRTQLQAVLDNAEVGLVLTRNGRFELVSRRFLETFGYATAEIIGRPTTLIHPSQEAYDEFSTRAHPAFMAQGLFDGEVELQRADGSLIWARMRGRAVVPGDRSQGTIWAIADTTMERTQRDLLTWEANHDRLTGLSNRAAFEGLLDTAMAHAGKEPFCALFIDLDRFKQVNDTGGHAAGDALLRDVARELASRVRKTDTVARLGGDEFAVLLPHCPLAQATRLAEELRSAVEAYRLEWDGQSFGVGASIGVVCADGSQSSAVDVMRAADAACYEAKRGGRNQVALAA